MQNATLEQKLNALTHVLTSPTTNPPLYSQFFISKQIPCYLNWEYPPLFCPMHPKSLCPNLKWEFLLFLKKVSNWGVRKASWRSKCPYQQPPPLYLAKGVEAAQWDDDLRRAYIKKRMKRKKAEININPLIPSMLPNILLLSSLLWNPFRDED